MSKKVKQQKVFYRRKPSDIVFNIINYGVFGIFAIACFFPFYYIFINTISNNDLVKRGAIKLIPKGLQLQNYLALRQVDELGRAFLVTVGRTVLGTALMVLASAFIGYIVTKQEMWHRKLWYRFMIVTMYFNAGIIPWFVTLSALNLTGTFWGYIIPGIVAPYNIILVKTYIESIPAELEESAQMDGASYMTVFRKIIWPLSKPILATIAIFGAVGHWNSFTDSIILMSSTPKWYTLQHILYNYLNKTTNIQAMMSNPDMIASGNQLNEKAIKYTVSMVSVIPILIVYPFMNRYFEEGIMLGAVKG
ncbi:MAG: carbohydrate ABC transporter permease [bacterium]|nr:carbohydrate ABC transporter permease [bacterium]